MQENKLTDPAYGVLNVPLDLLVEVGIKENAVIQFYVDDGKLIIQTVEADEDYVCDGDCDGCVFTDNCPYEDDEPEDEDEVAGDNDESCEGEICEECEYFCHHCKKCVLD